MKKTKKFNLEEFIFDLIVYSILLLFTLACLFPMWHIVMAAFSNTTDIATAKGLILWPKKIDLGAFKLVFANRELMLGFKNTLLYLAGSLPINLLLTVMAGYFLASTNLMWKKQIAGIITFTMFFSGGMIPQFLNIKDLGLIDSLWALILSGALSVYNAMICKTSIEAIPDSLREAAYIDGANDFQVIFKVIIPLIKATLAVLTLYYGVAHWNAWFNASIYLRTEDKLPMQNILRSILIANQTGGDMDVDDFNAYAETIRYAAIVFSTLPIMCVYPFLQKYFTKGALIGAVKG